jgi:hypothetical protein
MAQTYTATTPLGSTPYLTLTEFKNAPTSVDVDDLIGGGTQAVQDAELTNVIARASSMMDTYCNQVLTATLDTETMRVRPKRDGTLVLHPRYWPIRSVSAISTGKSPQYLYAVDTTTVWIEPMEVIIPQAQSWPTGFNTSSMYGIDVFVQMSYVNGWANTTTSATVLSNAANLPLRNVTGIIPGDTLTIYDGINTENVTVATSWTPTTGAASVPLAANTTFAHATVGTSVSALPPAVKQAAIYYVTALLKARGSVALVMDSVSPGRTIEDTMGIHADITMGQTLLQPFRRIR